MLAAADQLDYRRWRASTEDFLMTEWRDKTRSLGAMAMKAYFQDWWLPGKPHGASCADLERLGSQESRPGEASKPVKKPRKTLRWPQKAVTRAPRKRHYNFRALKSKI